MARRDGTARQGHVTCSIHGKSRGQRYMTQDGDDQWICQEGYECNTMRDRKGSSSPDRWQARFNGRGAASRSRSRSRSAWRDRRRDRGGSEWQCQCGFKNKGSNQVCGGTGPMGCKRRRREAERRDAPPPPGYGMPPPGYGMHYGMMPGMMPHMGMMHPAMAMYQGQWQQMMQQGGAMPAGADWARWFQQGVNAMKGKKKKKKKKKNKAEAESDQESSSSSSSSSADQLAPAVTNRPETFEKQPVKDKSVADMFENPPPGVGRRQAAKNAVEKLIRDCKLSPEVSWQLRALPPDKQKHIFRLESELKEQDDPSAFILMKLQVDEPRDMGSTDAKTFNFYG